MRSGFPFLGTYDVRFFHGGGDSDCPRRETLD
jgi:hypothetical protein